MLPNLDQQGYQPATLPELLAFEAQYSYNPFSDGQLAALGSIGLTSKGMTMSATTFMNSWFQLELAVQTLDWVWSFDCNYLVKKKIEPDKIQDVSFLSEPKDSMSRFLADVNYHQSYANLLNAGKYGWAGENMDPFFMLRVKPKAVGGIATIYFAVVQFNNVISIESAVDILKQKGWRLAVIDEMLVFGAKYTEEQKKYPIISLSKIGSIGFGNKVVGYIYNGKRGRELNYAMPHSYWFTNAFRFLAVVPK